MRIMVQNLEKRAFVIRRSQPIGAWVGEFSPVRAGVGALTGAGAVGRTGVGAGVDEGGAKASAFSDFFVVLRLAFLDIILSHFPTIAHVPSDPHWIP